MQKSELFLVNVMYKILWDFEIQIEYFVPNRKTKPSVNLKKKSEFAV